MNLAFYRIGNLVLVSIAAVIGFLCGLHFGGNSPRVAANNRLSMWTVLSNNLRVGCLIILLGLISLGVGSLILIAYNQVIFGAAVGGVYMQSGCDPIVTGVLPHALPELAATAICGVLGFESWRPQDPQEKNRFRRHNSLRRQGDNYPWLLRSGTLSSRRRYRIDDLIREGWLSDGNKCASIAGRFDIRLR